MPIARNWSNSWSTRLLPRRGIFANPDEVLIVAGAQQAIYLIAELLGGPDRRVAVGGFGGYPDGRNILQLHFGDVVPVGTDAQGLRVAELPEDATVAGHPESAVPAGRGAVAGTAAGAA